MAGLIGLIVLGGIALVLVLWIAGIYNRLVTLKNRFQNAFAQIEVQLKRRYHLIPNLVETAKGYLAHDRETLEAVISARNEALAGLKAAAAAPGGAEAMKQLAGAEGALAGALGRLSVVVEQYLDIIDRVARERGLDGVRDRLRRARTEARWAGVRSRC